MLPPMAFHHDRQLPSKIKAVANSSVHAVATMGHVLMRCISREKDTLSLGPITLGNANIRSPHALDQYLIDFDWIRTYQSA